MENVFKQGCRYYFDTICDERYNIEIVKRTPKKVSVKFLNGRYQDVIKTYNILTLCKSEMFLPFGSGPCSATCLASSIIE